MTLLKRAPFFSHRSPPFPSGGEFSPQPRNPSDQEMAKPARQYGGIPPFFFLKGSLFSPKCVFPFPADSGFGGQWFLPAADLWIAAELLDLLLPTPLCPKAPFAGRRLIKKVSFPPPSYQGRKVTSSKAPAPRQTAFHNQNQ